MMERNSSKVTKSGYLYKYEESLLGMRSWKKYYFILKSNFLSWYPDAHSATPVGMVDLEEARIYESPAKKKKHEGCEFEVKSPAKTVLIRCDYAKELKPWIQALSMAKARHLTSHTVDLDKGMR